MFCKFCGQTLSPSASVCSRCGRDVPAKSECGGFQQIMFGAAGPAKPAVAPQPEQTPAKQPVPVLSLVLAAVIVIALILIAVQGSNLNGLKVQLRQTQKELSELTDALHAHEEAGHPTQNAGNSGGVPTKPTVETTLPEEEPTEFPSTEPTVTTVPVESVTLPPETGPEESVKPEDPTEPEAPVGTEDPTEPEAPVGTEDPTEPEAPVGTENPAEPEAPVGAGDPGQTSDPALPEDDAQET